MLAVGVDSGRTRIRIVILGPGRRRRRIVAPAIHTHELGRLLRRAAGGGRTRIGSLVVGAAGIWTARERERLRRELAGLARRVRVLSDVEVALIGSLGDRPGILVLAGTGSIVLGRDAQGRWARAGGLGPLVGDEGSGFWLGREWLRVTTRGEDSPAARRLVTTPDAVRRIAALAPAVIARARRGDRRAQAIVRAGQESLAAAATGVARRLRLPHPVDVSWAGSVLDNPWYRLGVARALTRAGLSARWHTPVAEPAVAAARLAAASMGRRP